MTWVQGWVRAPGEMRPPPGPAGGVSRHSPPRLVHPRLGRGRVRVDVPGPLPGSVPPALASGGGGGAARGRGLAARGASTQSLAAAPPPVSDRVLATVASCRRGGAAGQPAVPVRAPPLPLQGLCAQRLLLP